MFAKIIATGGYLPSKIVTNDDLAKIVDTSDEWIVERTGIKQRHIAEPHQTTSEIAEYAARQAMTEANISAQSLDLIIVATSTPDHVYPSTAALLQARLGNVSCPAFDISAACSGFIYGLSIADNFIKAGTAKRVLIVGAEIYSRIIDWNDRTTCVLFGDGAAAVILEASTTTGILSTHIHADGRFKDALNVEKGAGAIEGMSPFVQMKGNDVYKHAVTKLHQIVSETLVANQMPAHKIDWLIPHQANLRIITSTAKKLEMPMEKVIVTVDKHANTSAASIPLALDLARKDGRIKANDLVLLEAFGAGFTWGSALIRM